MKKPTVTVGIPAYNEEANIGLLIKEVQMQKNLNFNLSEIIVYSDASSDHTNEIVQSIKDSRIILLASKKRHGVAYGQNQIIKRSTSDILILINGDSSSYREHFIEKLVAAFSHGEPDLVAAMIKELPPKSLLEKILFVSMKFKARVFTSYRKGDNIFTCHGNCRALSRRFYKSIVFPQSVGEDMFCYLYCIKHNFKYKFVKDAFIYYKLPDNMRDHERQSLRFHRSTDWLKVEFGKDFVGQHTYIPYFLFIWYGFLTFLEYPFEMFSYLFIVSYLFIKSQFRPLAGHTNTWPIAISSKNLGGGI